MSKEDDNKAIVVRWFTDFWGENVNLNVVDDIASPDMLLKYSLHEPRRGHDDIKAFMTDFRAAFPDLQFGATADLIAEGDYVVGQWEGGGTHTGPAFGDFLVGSLPAGSHGASCPFSKAAGEGSRKAPSPQCCSPPMTGSKCAYSKLHMYIVRARAGPVRAEIEARNYRGS